MVRVSIFVASLLALLQYAYGSEKVYYRETLKEALTGFETEHTRDPYESSEQLHTHKESGKTQRAHKTTQCCTIDATSHLNENASFIRECHNRTLARHNFTKYRLSPGDRNSTEFKMKLQTFESYALCYVQCMLQKYDAVNKEGMITLDGIANFFSLIYNGTWVTPFTKSIANTCFQQVRQQSLEYVRAKNITTCNPALISLHNCTLREVQLSCPAKYIGNVTACELLKKQKT
ncbi:uncharacterized protein LOC116172342 [Photinus pyralis]|uniref:uncharacterized protein LOC116172342 n=1 Tax=Photinus pyralis TaxID=7054 RepID=UPI0012673D14|nr:uncharacterized protein LOC116172342 [Photinus pyralis]